MSVLHLARNAEVVNRLSGTSDEELPFEMLEDTV